jgi:hypothetical protein
MLLREEEVWVQLHSQRIQLRLRQLRFQPARQKLALAILAIEIERVIDADHGAVHRQVRRKRTRQAREVARPECCDSGTHAVERLDG